jgi:hypothetical protein
MIFTATTKNGIHSDKREGTDTRMSFRGSWKAFDI